jgi:hypothetical protein
MKIKDLTNEELDYLILKKPLWFSFKIPEYMFEHHIDLLLKYRPEWISFNKPEIMFELNSWLLLLHNSSWVIDNKPFQLLIGEKFIDWICRNKPNLILNKNSKVLAHTNPSWMFENALDKLVDERIEFVCLVYPDKIYDCYPDKHEQLCIYNSEWVFNKDPNLLFKVLPVWICFNKPEALIEHNGLLLALHNPEWLFNYDSLWMIENYTDWVIKNKLEWVKENHPEKLNEVIDINNTEIELSDSLERLLAFIN